MIWDGFIYLFLSLIFILLVVLVERKLLAFAQRRVGPSIMGRNGIYQVVTDLIKLIKKSFFLVSNSINSSSTICVFILFFSQLFLSQILILGINISIFDNISSIILYQIILTLIGNICVLLIGVFSQSKYATIGAVRAVSHIVSLDIFITITYMILVLSSQSINFQDFVFCQLSFWFILLFSPCACGFFLLLFLDSKRTPFDHLENESELVSGYSIEFGGGLLMLIYLIEYFHLIVAVIQFILCFLGGWFLFNIISVFTPLFYTNFEWIHSDYMFFSQSLVNINNIFMYIFNVFFKLLFIIFSFLFDIVSILFVKAANTYVNFLVFRGMHNISYFLDVSYPYDPNSMEFRSCDEYPFKYKQEMLKNSSFLKYFLNSMFLFFKLETPIFIRGILNFFKLNTLFSNIYQLFNYGSNIRLELLNFFSKPIDYFEVHIRYFNNSIYFYSKNIFDEFSKRYDIIFKIEKDKYTDLILKREDRYNLISKIYLHVCIHEVQKAHTIVVKYRPDIKNLYKKLCIMPTIIFNIYKFFFRIGCSIKSLSWDFIFFFKELRINISYTFFFKKIHFVFYISYVILSGAYYTLEYFRILLNEIVNYISNCNKYVVDIFFFYNKAEE